MSILRGHQLLEKEEIQLYESEDDLLGVVTFLREIKIREIDIGHALAVAFRLEAEKIIHMALDFWANKEAPAHKEVAHMIRGAQLL